MFEGIMNEAVKRGHMSNILKEALQNCPTVDDPEFRCVPFYKCQSLQKLGEISERVHVPTYIDASVHGSWIQHLDKAIEVINKAAPGLYLFKESNNSNAKIRIYGHDTNGCGTKGTILSCPYAEIFLNDNWKMKKRTSVHELFHALGFEHEHQRKDATEAIDLLKTDDQCQTRHYYTGLGRFDPLSIMLYCEGQDFSRKSEGDIVWKQKKSTKLVDKMSELDKVGLNLIYRPCRGPNYNPQVSHITGMWYCGRRVMKHHNRPAKSIVGGLCGPNKSANCPACRTLEFQRVWKDKKWQGWSGLVYCGSKNDASKIVCGPDKGTPCTDCKNIVEHSMSCILL